MRRNTLVQIGLLAAGVVLVGIIVVTIWLGWTGRIDSRTASLVIGGVSAFASASLAIATYTTVLQNRRTVEELQKDREKPLAQDVLRQLVAPFKQQIEDHIDRMESDYPPWVQIWNTYGEQHATRFYQELSTDRASDTAVRKLRRDNPDLMKQIDKHNQSVRDVEETIEALLSRLDERVEVLLGERVADHMDINDEEIRVLSKCVLQGYSQDASSLYATELWEAYSGELQELKDEEIVAELSNTRSDYYSECQSIRDALLEYKMEIQQQYGISESDL